MNGLIRKDLMSIKSSVAIMVVASLAFSLAFGWDSPMVVLMMITSMMSVVYGGCFMYDSKCGWDAFAVSSGVPRGRIVSSKFIGGSLMTLAGVAMSIAVATAISLVRGIGPDATALAYGIVTALLFGLCLNSVNCTANFVLENGKAQMLSSVIVGSLVALTVIVSSMTDGILDEVPWFVPAAIAVVFIAITIAGYGVSMRRFLTKDL